MMTEETPLIAKKAQFYLDKSQCIHILLETGIFYNGYLKYIGADFLLVEDIKKGETMIFFSEVKAIEPYMNKESL